VTKVKICGLTRVEDARAAAQAGADFLGFVFYPPSPRYVGPEAARRIIDTIRPTSSLIRTVGVFVDESLDAIRQTSRHSGLDYVQLHGSEPPEMASALMAEGLGTIKAFRVRDGASLDGVARYRVTAYLLDAYVPGEAGGTGTTFDWALVAQAKAHGRVILAGGLNAENVAAAVRATDPWGVDVSSGVETEPGRKDTDKIRRFVARAKGCSTGGIRQ
jgi:phosphoribosylanthranilate isomerase